MVSSGSLSRRFAWTAPFLGLGLGFNCKFGSQLFDVVLNFVGVGFGDGTKPIFERHKAMTIVLNTINATPGRMLLNFIIQYLVAQTKTKV